MKLPLFLVAACLLSPVPLFAGGDAATPALPSSPPLAIEFHRWQQGQPPVKLIRREEGFCALTSVTGHFQGRGEEVRVYVAPDGYWYLGGASAQIDVAAECLVVRCPVAAEPVKVLAATYLYGSSAADVTVRVRELLQAGGAFNANPGTLRVDPHPGMNKALAIFCEVRGKRAVFTADEGGEVSSALLLEKARPVSEPLNTSEEQEVVPLLALPRPKQPVP